MAARDSFSYADLLSDPRLASVLLIGAVGALGSNVLSPALPAIASGLDVPDARVGLLLTVFKLSAVVMILFTGFVADLYGRRPLLLGSLVVFGVAGTAMTQADAFIALLVLAVGLGIGFGGVMPLSIALVGDFYSGVAGSAAQGLRAAFLGLVTIVVPPLTGSLADLHWQLPFVLFAAAFPVGIVVFLFVPESVDGNDESEPISHYLDAVRTEVTEPTMAVLISGGFMRDFVRYAVLTYLPLFAVRSLEASFFVAGLVLSIRGVVHVLVSPFTGSVVARLSRRTAMVGAFGLSAVGVLSIPLSSDVVWLGAAMGVYSVGDAVASPVVKDSVTDTASDSRRTGIVSTLTLVKNSAQGISPAVFGPVLVLLGFGAVFGTAGALAVGYALLVGAVVSNEV